MSSAPVVCMEQDRGSGGDIRARALVTGGCSSVTAYRQKQASSAWEFSAGACSRGQVERRIKQSPVLPTGATTEGLTEHAE